MAQKSEAAPAAVVTAVRRLGANIALARKRRQWSQEYLAERAGVTRITERRVEEGKLGTGIGAYVAVLWALDLHRDLELLAGPALDTEGLTLMDARLGERIRPSGTLDDDF